MLITIYCNSANDGTCIALIKTGNSICCRHPEMVMLYQMLLLCSHVVMCVCRRLIGHFSSNQSDS